MGRQVDPTALISLSVRVWFALSVGTLFRGKALNSGQALKYSVTVRC